MKTLICIVLCVAMFACTTESVVDSPPQETDALAVVQIDTGLNVSGCCDYLTITYDIPNAAKLVLIDDRHERILAISDSGFYKSYIVDAIQIRDAANDVLRSKYIQNCCPRRYRVEGAHIYFNEPGDYTIHKKMGFGEDVKWVRKYKAYNPGSQTWIGSGTFVVTWISPNKSYHTVDIVRIY